MKKGIFPLWEDIHNRDGGAWSYKIKKKDVDNFGLKLKELFELQDTMGIFLIFRNIF